MNKTLLLVLCDFLLLTLLALTRFEQAEPPRSKQAPVPEMAANAVSKEQDIVELMRQSLADEKSTRDELAQRLTVAETTLATREQSLTQVQTERARLAQEKESVASALTATQRTAEDLSRKVESATQEASLTKEQLAQIQRELAEKQAEAERQRHALSVLEKQQADARRQIEGLTLAVVVGEQEKKNLRETAETLKSQVENERSERLKVQEANAQLAGGLGQLAEKSVELTKELRDNRPINANVLFNDFQANRVKAAFAGGRPGFLGSVNRTKESNTILVTDGSQVYALLHIADTLFTLSETGQDWNSLSVELSKSGGPASPAPQLQFLAVDPRIVVLPLDTAKAAALGAKVFPLAVDPFKFPEAVLIDGGGRGYGEVGFKLDPAEPGLVRVDNRFFNRLFGDFAPKAGDLVFSKTGELLGIMVNKDYCVVLKDFSPMKAIQAGPDIRSQSTGALLDALYARLRAMPLKLQ